MRTVSPSPRPLIARIFLVGMMSLLGACSSSPQNVGLVDGHLHPCPPRPNCVCSEGDRTATSWIAPFAVQGSPERAWQRLKEVVRDAGGAIADEGDGYLRATFTSRVFRFVDDVEFLLDEKEGVIQVRSASRLGYSDLGVNRKRVERLRNLFERDGAADQGATETPSRP